MNDKIRELEPKSLWNNFADLNAVPRPSKKEERVRKFMIEFGNNLGLETAEDKIGNVIIKKPATEGMEDKQTVILQSHLDMVHQKNNDTVFDFENEGIRMIVDGDWVKADGTTLGADNGIGVATIMAILESKDIKHPAIEAMFTVDEETGMTGALNLDPKYYDGTILLNLDTEDDDELSIGCAGGLDTDTTYEYEEKDSPNNVLTYKVELKGLVGGHSGMDIHKGRGNANKMLVRLLSNTDLNIYLHEMEGGGVRNAIPREATAIVSVENSHSATFEKYIEKMASTFKNEYDPVEKSISLTATKTETPPKMVSEYETKAILATLNSVYNGVFKWSLKFDDLVETSSSLAFISVKNGIFKSSSLQRSSVESTKADMARTIRSPFDILGADVVQSGDYPGWEPNPDSPILKAMNEIYINRFNEQPKVQACHAGLECGILLSHLPHIDTISFGPNIRHAHSPDECVQISSVQKFWGYLLEVLEKIPGK
ncbi:MAG: aminoacyl-histidine dipeptidase [Brumimicrobium sp.]